MKKTPLDVTDRIRVVANVLYLDTNRYFVEVEFHDINGNRSTAILPRAIIRSGVRASEELLNRGAQLATGPGASAQVASLLSAVPERTYRITARPGWHGKSFVLPDMTIGPDVNALIHASRKFGETLPRPIKG